MAPLLSAVAWLCATALGSVAAEADALLAARVREVRAEGGSSRSTGELEVVPRLALLRHGELELTLSYAPRLTLPVDLSAGAPELASLSELRDRGEILHRVELAVEGAATRNLSLRLRADGASGRIDLRRSEVYVDEVLPIGERLAWRSARAAIEATATPTRRTTLSGGLRAFETGGADGEARDVVPLQRGLRLDAAVRYGATRRDELSLVVDASYSRFRGATDIARAAIVRLGGGWARSLGPTLAVRAAAGAAAWSYADTTPAGDAREIAPFAEVGLSHAPTRPSVATDLAVRLTPYLNPFTGGVNQRLEASATARWRAFRQWELAARAAGATRGDTSHAAFWTDERHAELASLDLRATCAFARRGTFSFGPRVRSQWSRDPSVPTFFEWGAALELAVGARWPG